MNSVVNRADSAVDVVYADSALVVVNKPAGLLCVPGRGPDKQDCLWRRVTAQFAGALVVHRLDMATSGLCLFARSTAAQTALSKAFAARQVHKRYEAVVAGQPVVGQPAIHAPDGDGWQLIDLPLIADWPNRPLQKVDLETGKPSLTRWRVSHQAGPVWFDATRLELAPLTGRSHQLRVHLLALGHPILGDALYAPPSVQQRAPRLLLHASELGFMHPETGQGLLVNCAVPF